MINVEITLILEGSRTAIYGILNLLLNAKPLYRNYLQVNDELHVNYTALQVQLKFSEVLMILLRNLFITVAWTASN